MIYDWKGDTRIDKLYFYIMNDIILCRTIGTKQYHFVLQYKQQNDCVIKQQDNNKNCFIIPTQKFKNIDGSKVEVLNKMIKFYNRKSEKETCLVYKTELIKTTQNEMFDIRQSYLNPILNVEKTGRYLYSEENNLKCRVDYYSIRENFLVGIYNYTDESKIYCGENKLVYYKL